MLQAAPSGRGLPKTQLGSQTAPNGRVPPRTQPRLIEAPNGRVIPKSPANSKSAPKKKREEIPYEIKNAREWDPNRRLQSDSSSESSDDDDFNDSDYDEQRQVLGDGFQPVINKRFQSKARPHGQPPGQRRANPPVNLNYNRDNLARAAFRKRLDPTGRFTLPKDCPEIEANQKRMYDVFDEIGVRLGSFIRPPQHVKDRELLLWGDVRQVENTKAELQRFVDRQVGFPRKPMAKDKFARESSIIGDKYHQLTKKMAKEAMISEFQQVPAEGRVFPHMGTFLWPVNEVRPEDILGSSLEAFDPIRFQYHCHIVFDTKLSSFRIFSDKEDSVQKTMERIVGTMREYVAKSARPEMLILIEPPSSSAIRKDVKVLPVSHNSSKTNKSMVPVLTGSTLDSQGHNEWLKESTKLMLENHRRMELSLRKCIANLLHYRDLVRMRVQFGTFALKAFRWEEGAESTRLEEFMNNMNMSGTKAVMIRE